MEILGVPSLDGMGALMAVVIWRAKQPNDLAYVDIELISYEEPIDLGRRSVFECWFEPAGGATRPPPGPYLGYKLVSSI